MNSLTAAVFATAPDHIMANYDGLSNPPGETLDSELIALMILRRWAKYTRELEERIGRLER